MLLEQLPLLHDGERQVGDAELLGEADGLGLREGRPGAEQHPSECDGGGHDADRPDPVLAHCASSVIDRAGVFALI